MYTFTHTYTSKIYPYINIHLYSEPRIRQDINNDGGKKRKKDGHTSRQLFTHAHVARLGLVFIPKNDK